MVVIPHCIAWSISQLMSKCIDEVKSQEEEMYTMCLCDKTKYLIHCNMVRRFEILKKIEHIMPILNQYYDKESSMFKNEEYKKEIEEFVMWLKDLEEIKHMYIKNWEF